MERLGLKMIRIIFCILMFCSCNIKEERIYSIKINSKSSSHDPFFENIEIISRDDGIDSDYVFKISQSYFEITWSHSGEVSRESVEELLVELENACWKKIPNNEYLISDAGFWRETELITVIGNSKRVYNFKNGDALSYSQHKRRERNIEEWIKGCKYRSLEKNGRIPPWILNFHYVEIWDMLFKLLPKEKSSKIY